MGTSQRQAVKIGHRRTDSGHGSAGILPGGSEALHRAAACRWASWPIPAASSASMSSQRQLTRGDKAGHPIMACLGVPGADAHSGHVRAEGHPAFSAHVFAVRASVGFTWSLSVHAPPMARWRRKETAERSMGRVSAARVHRSQKEGKVHCV